MFNFLFIFWVLYSYIELKLWCLTSECWLYIIWIRLLTSTSSPSLLRIHNTRILSLCSCIMIHACLCQQLCQKIKIIIIIKKPCSLEFIRVVDKTHQQFFFQIVKLFCFVFCFNSLSLSLSLSLSFYFFFFVFFFLIHALTIICCNIGSACGPTQNIYTNTLRSLFIHFKMLVLFKKIKFLRKHHLMHCF